MWWFCFMGDVVGFYIELLIWIHRCVFFLCVCVRVDSAMGIVFMVGVSEYPDCIYQYVPK